LPLPDSPHKIIRDVVHGYIPLAESDICIIDTPFFQRLKRIHQTGAQSVYPSANHTRFEHSLGVMYLGTKILNSLRALGVDLDDRLQNTLKTVFEFEAAIEDSAHQDALISQVGRYSKEEGGLPELERRIIEADGDLSPGDFYIAVADFKPFVPVIDKAIYIVLRNKVKRFQDIFQKNIYRKPHRELLYIFVRDNRVKDILLKKLNQGCLV
jgi:hypothetical protein